MEHLSFLTKNFNITITEFWSITPGDFWLMYDAKVHSMNMEKEASGNGELTKDEYEDILTFDERMPKQ